MPVAANLPSQMANSLLLGKLSDMVSKRPSGVLATVISTEPPAGTATGKCIQAPVSKAAVRLTERGPALGTTFTYGGDEMFGRAGFSGGRLT